MSEIANFIVCIFCHSKNNDLISLQPQTGNVFKITDMTLKKSLKYFLIVRFWLSLQF